MRTSHDQIPTILLADLPVTTPEDLCDHGFLYNVPTELTEDEGRGVERIIARGAPKWVGELRERSGRCHFIEILRWRLPDDGD